MTLGAVALVAACHRPPDISTTTNTANPRPEKTMTNRILIATTSHATKGNTGEPTGAYLAEIAHPYDVFTKAGYAVDIASVRGGQVPLDGLDAKDDVSATFRDSPQRKAELASTPPSSIVDPARYRAIFYAGGHGTMWDFPDDAGFQRVARSIYEAGGVVAAVCHGPAALVNLRLSSGVLLVSGKEVSAFTNEEERAVGLEGVVPFLLADRLVAGGARFSPAPKWQEHVVVSGRLVTGQNPASASGVARAVVTTLADIAPK